MALKKTIEHNDLKNILQLSSQAQEALIDILDQFKGSYREKLDRSNMDKAKKQRIKLGVGSLVKNKMIFPIPKTRSTYMLNPYVFQSKFNHHDEAHWNQLVKEKKQQSVPLYVKSLPKIFTIEVIREYRDREKRLAIKSSLQCEEHNVFDETIRQDILDQDHIDLGDNILYFKVAIEQFLKYLYQNPIGLTFHECYDNTLPSVRFHGILDKYSRSLSSGTYQNPNRSLLSFLKDIKTEHSSSCIELRNNGQECACYEKCYQGLRRILEEDNVMWNEEFNVFTKDWFSTYYPEWFI